MNYKLLFILTLFFLYSPRLVGQTNKRSNIWYFGENAGLDFTSGTPVPLTDGALTISEGCATICDENGGLLFYTDGRSIWNRKHAVMPNATDLGGDESASQSGIIVPFPDNANQYFVFSVDKEGRSGGVQYALVDMTLNGGSGGLISKNNRLLAKASEKLTAIRHCNNKDFWVVAHEINTNSFRAYLITSNGINATSVESKIGSVQGDFSAAIGYMKASTDGKKIAVCSWSAARVELFDFDNKTGSLSNVISYRDNKMRYAYGAEFSPSNQYLYVSCAESKIIHQFEVNVTTDADFASSRVEIGSSSVRGVVRVGALQLAPNNLIYVALDDVKFLGVINKPDAKGIACTYVDGGINLANKKSQLGLPNSITTYAKKPLSVTAISTKGASCTDVTLVATTVSTAQNLVYQWFLDNKPISGGTQSSVKPVRSGNYIVSVKEPGQCTSDSAKSIPIAIFILEVNPKIVSTYCGSVKLQANANASLKWSGTGISVSQATQDTLTVSGSGTQIYKVQVVNPVDNTCSVEKEVTVNFTNGATYSFGKNNVTACDTTTLLAPTGSNWNSYVWSLPDGTTVKSTKLVVRQSGQYVITVKNTTTDCEAKDKVDVSIGKAPTLKADEKLCIAPNSSVTIQAGATGTALTYEWLPGNARTDAITVNTAGTYQVKAISPEGCSATRSIEINQVPAVNLGNDITVCAGEPVRLQPQQTALAGTATYLWSTGETASSIVPPGSGLYTVKVQQSGCQATDSIRVTINPSPKTKADETVCLEKTIDAGGLENDLIYVWQDLGETKPTVEITKEGVYTVKISNQSGCSTVRTITVDGSCDPRIFAPDAFSPNHDGINDTFKVTVVGGESIRLDIFNRWNNPVYSEESTNPKWNGDYKGETAGSGIYPYVLTYRLLKSNVVQKYRGTLVILH